MTFLVKFVAFFAIAVLVFPFLLTLGNMLFSKKTRKAKFIPDPNTDFACVITAYQQIDIAVPLVNALLDQVHDLYHVYLVADCAEKEDFKISDSPKLTVLKPSEALNGKLKSIRYAIDNFIRQHEFTVVFDPDNLVNSDYLECLSRYTSAGFCAVQTCRVAKNLDTHYAKLDSVGETYQNFITRYLPFRLGSSSTIAGSGMMVSTYIFNGFLNSEEIISKWDDVILGEDKMLHNYIINHSKIIAFAKEILTYDEKVARGQDITRQRTRWIKTYFENFESAVRIALKGVVDGFIWNQILFGIVSMYPPLFLLVTLSLLLSFILFWFLPKAAFLILTGVLLFSLNFFIALVFMNTPKKVYLSLLMIPMFIVRQFISLFSMRNTKNNFLVTRKKEFNN